MKTLILIRHAKSSWDTENTDINRPLSRRGLHDAKLLSNELLKYSFVPDAVFSSPADRALTTCKLFMDTLNFPTKLLIVKNELYDFEGNQVLDIIHNIDDANDLVFIFGHNHAFTAVANSLGDAPIENVPTCGLVMLQFDVNSWNNIDKGHTKMTLFPKELRS